jgi:hypothetical protein
MTVPLDRRFGEYADAATYPANTLFHPTMFYEAAWLFLTFGLLYFFFRRNQEAFIHGIIAGIYLIAAGFGRFWAEFFRLDQPKIADSPLSYSQIFALLYMAVGLVIVLDRLGHINMYAFFKVFFRNSPVSRPQTRRQRQQAFQALLADRKRQERASEREKLRAERRKQREAARREQADQQNNPSAEES